MGGVEGGEGEQGGGAVDVALDDVTAEGEPAGVGELEVDGGGGGEMAEGGAGEGFLGEVGGEAGGLAGM